MPDPETVKVVLEFRRRLLALDATAAAKLVAAYGPIWTEIKGEIDNLLAQVAERELTWGQTQRLGRLTDILGQVEREVSRYSRTARGVITDAQRAAVGLSQQAVRRTVNVALPPGITLDILARQGIAWNALPVEAFETFVGLSGNGAPLGRLLSTLGSEAAAGVKEALGQGIVQGRGPRETARLVRNRFGMPLTRSLAISRTETLKSYREASRLQYTANKVVVKGYRRVSAKDERVCLACIALDDKLYENDEPLDEHVNGRCALVPQTVTYRDLGLDVDDPREESMNAREWFEEQEVATQREMLGAGRYAAWKDGAFDLEDMAKVERNATWGDQAVEKTLAELTR